MANELININSASMQGTSNPTKNGAQCHSSNANGYCAPCTRTLTSHLPYSHTACAQA